MTAAEIRALRDALRESRTDFGRRFATSGRTVEGWEQDRFDPPPLTMRELEKLQAKMKKSGKL